tara:strand:- start:9892 stop:17496 length:7605 start_codon:yes stop_codon:yes gene_type:complete
MAQGVKYINFDEVEGAPRLAIPEEFDQTQIDNYLKSEKVENAMFEKGFLFKYGLQPVDMLQPENLDDGSFKAGLKKSYKNIKALGEGRVAAFNQFIGNKEKQQEAIRVAQQYQLDTAANAYRYDPETGKVIPRPNTIEDIFASEQQLTAFTRYVKGTMGSAAASSLPTLLLSAFGGAVGFFAGGPPGAAGGATVGALMSGYMFGVGENYLAQAEETDDPNLGISLALAIPYAAAERIGIGGVVPSLVKTLGKGGALKALAKPGGLLHEVEKQIAGKGFKRFSGEIGKGMLRTGAEESLAEAIQETVTTTAGGLEAGKSFEELYGNKDFAKQLGEAAAAGFFGGFGFGALNPTLKQVKSLSDQRGVQKDLKGGGGTFDLDTYEGSAMNRAVFGGVLDKNLKIGSTVLLKERPDLIGPKHFKKPKFKVLGTTLRDDQVNFVLQSRDIEAATVFVPIDQIDRVTVVADESTGGGDREENFTYNQQSEEEIANNDQQVNNYKQNKKTMQREGHMSSRTESAVEEKLGGRDKIIDDVVTEIEFQRDSQKESMTEEGPIDFIDNAFKKYDAFSGARLREEVAKDYTYWKRESFNNEAEGTVGENKLSKTDEDTLTELGYNDGQRGIDYINKRRSNVTKKGKNKTEGREELDEIIKSAQTENPKRFGMVPADKGGPVEVERIVGEKISRKEPITAEERASLSGDRLINVIKYNPRTYTESSTFEDLYNVPLQSRIRDALELGQHLDSRGWKNKNIKSKTMTQAIASFNSTIATAKFEFGLISKSYKQAVQAKKDFLNTELHTLVNPFAPAGTFSLIPILSPKAVRQAEREVQKLKADSRSRSDNPEISGPIIQKIQAYEHIIKHTPYSRKQLNTLLKSMSLDPILDWETFTDSKLKSSLTAYTKKVNRNRAEVKKTPVKLTYTQLSKGDGTTPTNPGITERVAESRIAIAAAFREMLNKLGLPGIDLGIQRRLEGVNTQGEFRKPTFKGELFLQDTIAEYEEADGYSQSTDLWTQHFRLISVAFNLDEYIKLKNYPLDKQDNASVNNYRNYQNRAAGMLRKAKKTLNHEVVHALKDGKAFTDTEWRLLTKIAKEQFLPMYLPKNSSLRRFYIRQFKEQRKNDSTISISIEDQLVEEAIARAFGDFAVGNAVSKYVDLEYNNKNKAIESKIQKIFRKIKAYLLSLVYGLKTTGFNSPLDIFDKIQAGIVGARVRTDYEAVDMATHADINQMVMESAGGDIILTNKMEYNTLSRNILQDVYSNWLSQYMEETDYKNIDIKFSTDINKVRWSMESDSMGGMSILAPYTAMYTPMSVKQYQSLVPYLDYKDQRSTRSIKVLTKGIKNNKPIGAPMLEIDINSNTLVGRVVSHEGRHRSFSTGLLHGDQTVMPVATVFRIDSDIVKDNPQGRQDPVNKKIIADFIEKGTIQTQYDPSNTQSTSKLIDKVFQEYETTDRNKYKFKKEYNNENDLTTVSYAVGAVPDYEDKQNRQEKSNTARQIKNNVNKAEKNNTSNVYTYENMTLFSKIMGHARAWAKNPNTPFHKLYGAVQNRLSKGRMLQAQYSSRLRRRYLEIKKDPFMDELLTKAHIISQMTRKRVKMNDKGELVFVAPKDSSDKNKTVKAGEIVILTGDAAGAFADFESVIFSIADEYLASEIARDHVPNLLSALDLMRRYFPKLPELQTLFNFEGLTEEQISARLETLSPAQIRFIHNQIMNIMIMPTSMDGTVIEEIDILLGNETLGLNKLKTIANEVEGRKQTHYAPLSRYGDIFVSVKQMVKLKNKEGKIIEKEMLLNYQQFETNAEAQEGYRKLRLEYPDANVSQPAKHTIDATRALLRSTTKPPGLEFVSQYMSDTSARKFNEAMKELRQVLADKKLDKNILGIDQFFAQRDTSVGLEGVPGYSPDFTRSMLQYIAVSSTALARNRFAHDVANGYTETITHAVEKGDTKLKEGTEAFYKYEEDPTHEWAAARRVGFWWYLGGNMSSALLQIMSAVQFTGPLLGTMGGNRAAVSELTKSFADASASVYRGTVGGGERQYDDAFIDFSYFDKYKLTEPGLYNALMEAIADGTIKQGQVLQEAGMTESLADTSGSNKKTIKKIENVLVGGAFNTMESLSRITAFIAAYRLAEKNPKTLQNAALIYEGDMDYQRHKEIHGESSAAFARFMTEETFGVYGKENRPWLARGGGSLPALFMTYITQMFGLMYRLLNPPVLKMKDGRLSVGLANPNKSAAANAIGRRAFAKIALMIALTGGLMGLPGAEDAEDIVNAMRKLRNGGVDSDIRSEFRNMLYDAGWNAGLIEAMEAGLLNTFLNIDVQGRIGFGVAPWSRQVRAALSLAGFQSGARAEEFLGAPGSVIIDPIKGLVNEGLREGDWGSAAMKFLPTSIRNLTKVYQYNSRGYVQTGYGQVVTDDLSAIDLAMQALGFTSTEVSKNREALFLERKLDRAGSGFTKRMNAQITNALRDMILGGQRRDTKLINEGQQKIRDLMAKIIEHNKNNKPHLAFTPDMNRLRLEAISAINPNYRLMGNKKTMMEKIKLRKSMGLD